MQPWVGIQTLSLFICAALGMHLTCVLGFSRETEAIRISSSVYGGQEVLWSAVCKLENQESRCSNSVWIQRLENQGSWWCKLQPKCKDPRTRNTDVWGQEMDFLAQSESKFSLPPGFVLFRPLVDGMMSTCIGEGNQLSSVYWLKCYFLLETSS